MLRPDVRFHFQALGCIVGIMQCLAAIPLAAQQAPAGEPAAATRPVVTAGNFDFTLLGCRAVYVTVDCDVAIENRTQDDRRILVLSRQKGGIANIGLRPLGVTTIIEDSGQVHEAESLRFANQDEQENGQSFFQVYAGTHPVLTLHFENIGLRVARLSRLTVVAAEATQGSVHPLAVVFTNQPIARQVTNVSGPSPAPAVDKRFIIQTPAWRFVLQECRRMPDGVACTLLVTNLTDSRNAVFVGWQSGFGVRSLALESLGQTTVIDDAGATFPATQMFTQAPGWQAHEDTSNGQTSWLVEPFADRRFDLFFRNIGPGVTRLPRLDLALANQPLQGRPTRIAARFMDIPIAPMAQSADDVTVAPEWVPGPAGNDTDGEKLKICTTAEATMLQLLRQAAHDPKVQSLPAVAALPAAERGEMGNVQITGTSVSPVPGAPQGSMEFLCNVTYRGEPPLAGTAPGMTALMMNLTWVEPFRGEFHVNARTAAFRFVTLEMLTRFRLSNQKQLPLSLAR